MPHLPGRDQRRSVVALVCLSIILWLSSSAGASSLILRIETPRAELVLGEPVTLSAVLANVGAEPASAVPDLRVQSGFVKYWISDPTGAQRVFTPVVTYTPEGTATKLYPGDEVSATQQFVWGPEGIAFPTAGDYLIVATFVDGINTLTSDVLTLRMRGPQGSDAAALSMVLGVDQARFLQEGSYQFQEGILKLRQLVEQYPESVYAPYAIYALALRSSRKGWLHRSGVDSLDRIPPDYAQAINGFERIALEYGTSVVADDAQYELARTYRDMGDNARASQALQGFFDRYAATSDRLTDAVTLAEELGWDSARGPDSPAPSMQTWVPLREVLPSTYAVVTWVSSDQTVRVTRPGTAVELKVGSVIATLGQRRIPLAAPAKMEGGRLLIPQSFAQLLPRLLRQARQFDPIPTKGGAPLGG